MLHAAERHERSGGRVRQLPVDALGRVDPAGCAPPPGTALVCVQHANHEVGTVQPVAAVAEITHAAGVPLHTDAAMTVGRIPVDAGALGADLLTASAHKFGGPAGVGILVVRAGTRWANPMPADERELGRAAGFPNLPAIVAAATALHARAGELADERVRLGALTGELRARLRVLVDDVELLGDPDPAGRLPQLLAFSCLYVAGEALLGELDRAGIAVSSGSSCASDALTPSHVLVAMGALTHGNMRVSFGRDSSAADLTALLDVLPGAVAGIREPPGRPDCDHPRRTADARTAWVDSRGARCPLPVIDLARIHRGSIVGAMIAVSADDPAAGYDVAAWCRCAATRTWSESRGGIRSRARAARVPRSAAVSTDLGGGYGAISEAAAAEGLEPVEHEARSVLYSCGPTVSSERVAEQGPHRADRPTGSRAAVPVKNPARDASPTPVGSAFGVACEAGSTAGT